MIMSVFTLIFGEIYIVARGGEFLALPILVKVLGVILLSSFASSAMVPGRVEQNGAVWRIQMGPFASKSQAASLQQRLQSEAQLQSFIAVAK